MHLTRLVYYSENRLEPSDGPILGALQQILATSKRSNAARDITGALAFDDLWFFQVLEGEREAIWSTFKRILEDPRHGDIVLVGCVPIESRLFGAWSMRLVRVAEAASLFAPFTPDGIIRPHLMREADIVDVLHGMILADSQRAASAPRTPEEMRRDVLPRTAAIEP